MTATAHGQATGTTTGATTVTAGCPVRKLGRADGTVGPDLELVPGERPRRRVRSYALARSVLRYPEGTRQAGFGAEDLEGSAGVSFRPPILYLEGDPHHAQRRATAKLFAPRAVESYRRWIEATAECLVVQVRTDRWTELPRLSMQMAVR